MDQTSCHPRRTLARRGMSLIEVLIAALVIFFIFLSILPLFARAKASNRRGAEASKMSSFIQGDLEAVNQLVINHNTFAGSLNTQEELEKIADASASEDGSDDLVDKAHTLDHDFYYRTENYNGQPTMFYGTGSRDSVTLADEFLGDEGWRTRAEADIEQGNILWLRDAAYFGYGFSDVHSGTISVDSTNPTVTLVGHQRLFDNPLVWDENNPPDITETRLFIRSATSASPLGVGSVLALGYFRSF